MHADIRDFIDNPATPAQSSGPLVEADHGRIETRNASISDDGAWLEENHGWPGLVAIGTITRKREMNGKTTSETADYLVSANRSLRVKLKNAAWNNDYLTNLLTLS